MACFPRARGRRHDLSKIKLTTFTLRAYDVYIVNINGLHSQAFVLAFSEAVDQEVRDKGVQVMALCPGPVRTQFGKVSGMAPKMFASAPTADEAVRVGLCGLEQNKTVKFIKLREYAMSKPVGLMPRRLVTRTAMSMLRP